MFPLDAKFMLHVLLRKRLFMSLALLVEKLVREKVKVRLEILSILQRGGARDAKTLLYTEDVFPPQLFKKWKGGPDLIGGRLGRSGVVERGFCKSCCSQRQRARL